MLKCSEVNNPALQGRLLFPAALELNGSPRVAFPGGRHCVGGRHFPASATGGRTRQVRQWPWRHGPRYCAPFACGAWTAASLSRSPRPPPQRAERQARPGRGTDSTSQRWSATERTMGERDWCT